MTIHEPATFLTDMMLGALGFLLAWRLSRHTDSSHATQRWWKRSLLVMGTSAIVGGCYHGFAPNVPLPLAEIWWRLVLLLISLLGLCLGLGFVSEVIRPAHRRIWNRVMASKFLIFSALVIVHPLFMVAIIDYGLSMLLWAAGAVLRRRGWSPWILAAVGSSALAAWIQQSGLGLSAHFNNNDLFHVVQAVAVYAFYRAALLMDGRKGR